MIFLAFLLLIPLAVVIRAFVLTRLWSWFVTPQFGIAELGLWEAAGLSLIVGFLTYQYDARRQDKDREAKELLLEGVVILVIFNGFTLLSGWLIHLLAS